MQPLVFANVLAEIQTGHNPPHQFRSKPKHTMVSMSGCTCKCGSSTSYQIFFPCTRKYGFCTKNNPTILSFSAPFSKFSRLSNREP